MGKRNHSDPAQPAPQPLGDSHFGEGPAPAERLRLALLRAWVSPKPKALNNGAKIIIQERALAHHCAMKDWRGALELALSHSLRGDNREAYAHDLGPIHMASSSEDPAAHALLETLLAQGADPNRRCARLQMPPLAHALALPALANALALINKGADCRWKTKKNSLFSCFKSDRLSWRSEMGGDFAHDPSKASLAPLPSAPCPIIRALLERGANPSLADADGKGALDRFCEIDWAQGVWALALHGAQLMSFPRAQKNPLSFCIDLSHPRSAWALMQAGRRLESWHKDLIHQRIASIASKSSASFSDSAQMALAAETERWKSVLALQESFEIQAIIDPASSAGPKNPARL